MQLLAASPCAPDAVVCQTVFDATGSRLLADLVGTLLLLSWDGTTPLSATHHSMATVSPYVRFTVTLAGRRWLCYTLALAACSADRPPCSCSVSQVVSQTRAKCRHPAGGGRLPAGKCSEPHHERLTLHAAWLHSTDTPQSLAVQHRGRRPGPTGCSHRGPLDVGAERPSPQHADFRGHGVSSTGTRSAYRSPSACRRTGSCPRVSSPTDYTACPDLRASLSSRCMPARARNRAYAPSGACLSLPRWPCARAAIYA